MYKAKGNCFIPSFYKHLIYLRLPIFHCDDYISSLYRDFHSDDFVSHSLCFEEKKKLGVNPREFVATGSRLVAGGDKVPSSYNLTAMLRVCSS